MKNDASVSRPRRALAALAVVLSAFLAPGSTAAQPGAPPRQPAAPIPAPAPAAPDPLAVALAPRAGGLTPDEVGRTAAKTKHSVRAKQADLKAAAAKVDQALVTYFPRVTLTATYTRLSEVPGFSLGRPLGAGMGPLTNEGPLQVCGTNVCDAKGLPVGVGPAVAFPVVLNSVSFVASLAVPISDYLLRISQGVASASHAEKGKRLELEAETLQAAADAKISFFNWVRARGQVVVAQEAVEQAKAHVADANKAFAVGMISRADVLRLEAQVASAQQLAAEAAALAAVSEEQLRILLGLPSERPLAIGIDVMHEQATPPVETLAALQDQALQRRLEIRALDETIFSLKETVSIANAGYLPRLDAFADAIYANPNQRIFPSQDKFEFTWDAGVRLSWTINDTFTALGTSAEARARVASVTEQKGTLRDGLRVEVASAYADVTKAAVSIEAAGRQLAAAEESLRVRRELFRNGKATSVDLVDAETEATRARLSRLNARIGLLVARVRLDHAVGRDVPPRPAGE